MDGADFYAAFYKLLLEGFDVFDVKHQLYGGLTLFLSFGGRMKKDREPAHCRVQFDNAITIAPHRLIDEKFPIEMDHFVHLGGIDKDAVAACRHDRFRCYQRSFMAV